MQASSLLRALFIICIVPYILAQNATTTNGCDVIECDAECLLTSCRLAGESYYIPRTGPAHFEELQSFDICVNSTSSLCPRVGVDLRGGPPGSCVTSAQVTVLGCDASRYNGTYPDPPPQGTEILDMCEYYGLGPYQVLVFNESFPQIDCDTDTPVCYCFYIPTAEVLRVDSIDDLLFGVVVTAIRPSTADFSGSIVSYGELCTLPGEEPGCGPETNETSSSEVIVVPVTTGVTGLTIGGGTIGAGVITTDGGDGVIIDGDVDGGGDGFESSSSDSSSDDLALILGLSLGLGIPCLLLCCILLIAALILLCLNLKGKGPTVKTFWIPERDQL